MSNRRSFFKSLISLIVAPKVAAALPASNLVNTCVPPTGIVYAPYVPMIPMIRRTLAEITADDLVGIQSMSGPVGLASRMNYVYYKIPSNV